MEHNCPEFCPEDASSRDSTIGQNGWTGCIAVRALRRLQISRWMLLYTASANKSWLDGIWSARARDSPTSEHAKIIFESVHEISKTQSLS